jgi:hypothetical protein
VCGTKTDQASRSRFRIPELALDKPAVHQDRVLAFSPLQRRKDVVAELAVARFRAQLDRVVMVKLARHVDFSPSVLRDRRRAGEERTVSRFQTESCSAHEDALDLGWQSHRRLVELLIELVNQVDFPLQPLDLPRAEEEGKDGHDPDEDQERASAQFVPSRLRSTS